MGHLPADYTLEVGTYVGNAFLGVILGIDICMCSASVYLLLKKRQFHPRWTYFYISYGAVLLVLVTVNVVVNQYFGQLLWINDRGAPGGPPAWFSVNMNNPLYVTGNAVTVICNVLGDALMLHRYYIIVGRGWTIIAPSFLYVCTIGSSIAATVNAALPNGDIWSGVAVDLDMLWVASTVSFNVLVSTMICWRMISVGRAHPNKVYGEGFSNYTGIISMIVEATIPFTAVGIAYFIAQLCKSGTEATLGDVWSVLCALSPQLIILRIAMGFGWSKGTVQELTRTDEISMIISGSWQASNSASLSNTALGFPRMRTLSVTAKCSASTTDEPLATGEGNV